MSSTKRLIASPSRLPTRNRTSNCTHVQMTRLFDELGCDKCSICHRRPPLGWLYRCTQDIVGSLPASDAHDEENARQFNHDTQLYTLSPSIIKLAEEGHYTDEQLRVLWKQKIEVRQIIRQVR